MALRTMASSFRCTDCGAESLKWLGRCGHCQAWGTVEPVAAGATGRLGVAGRSRRPRTDPGGGPDAVPIGEVPVESSVARPTGSSELDRVLGGGLVPGSVLLLAGEPGVGKSTLLLATAGRVARAGQRVLVVTGEESAAQVRRRASRIGAVVDGVWLVAATDLAVVLRHVDDVRPDLLIVDSVQTIASADVDGLPGGVNQVREVAGALVAESRRRSMTTLLVGHVTKEGTIAGPRLLEHVVDVVLGVEGERSTPLRVLRAVKNRYGPTDEIGCFELAGDGVDDLPDPSGLFLSRGAGGTAAPGTCITAVLTGQRPMVAEVQALVSPATGSPRRAVSGLDANRLAMVLAVVEKRLRLRLANNDVYAASVGGMRVTEPAADLALALSVMTASRDMCLPPDVVALGEIGLTGEVRRVPAVDRRLAAAARLGFTRAIVPVGSPPPPAGVQAVPVADVRGALVAVDRFVRAGPGRGSEQHERSPSASGLPLSLP